MASMASVAAATPAPRPLIPLLLLQIGPPELRRPTLVREPNPVERPAQESVAAGKGERYRGAL